MSKHVIISRDWKNPTINIGITEDRISIDMTLDAFLSSLTEEYGNPATTLTKAQHLARLELAAQRVAESMKRETVRVA